MFSDEARIFEAFNDLNVIIGLVSDGKLDKTVAFDRIASIIEGDELAAAFSPPDDELVPPWPRVP